MRRRLAGPRMIAMGRMQTKPGAAGDIRGALAQAVAELSDLGMSPTAIARALGITDAAAGAQAAEVAAA